MIKQSKVRFGMVGAGAIAQAYAQSFQECLNAELVAVSDVRKDAAEAMASTAGAKSFDCHEAMVNDVALDAVVVCTPPSTHPDICEWLLHRNIPTLCEKPLAIDSAGAARILNASAANNTLFSMASKFRFVVDVIQAKAIVTSGVLGEIILFENTFTGRVDMSNRWNSNPEISGGGVLIDNGTHSVDIMHFFFGPLAEVQAVEGNRVQQLSVEDTARLFVKTDRGIMGSVDLSWSIHKPMPSYINIYGSNGTLTVGWQESKYKRMNDQEWTIFGNGYDKKKAFRDQLDNFAQAVRGEQSILVTPSEAAASVQVIEYAYRSMEQTRWLPIPQLPIAREESPQAVGDRA